MSDLIDKIIKTVYEDSLSVFNVYSQDFSRVQNIFWIEGGFYQFHCIECSSHFGLKIQVFCCPKTADFFKETFKASRLPSPTPCSPVQVPPNSRATFVISDESFFNSGYSSSLQGKTENIFKNFTIPYFSNRP